MNEREKLIGEYNRKIRDTEAAMRKSLEELGARLVEEPAEPTPEYAELRTKALEARAELEAAKKAAEEIKLTLERKGAIRYQLRQLDEQLQRLERENADEYQSLGETVYQAYNSGAVSGEGLSAVFTELIKQIVELRKLDRELEESRAALKDKAFLEKVVDQGRIAVLSGSKAVKERNLDREYWKAGKELCESGLLAGLEYEPVRTAADRCVANMAKITELKTLSASLSDEDAALTASLAELQAGKTPQRRLAELDRTIHELSESMKKPLADAAETYLSGRIPEAAADEEIVRITAEVQARRAEIQEYRTGIERQRALMRAEALTFELAEMGRKAATFEEQSRRYGQEAERLRAEIAAKEAERARLLDTAGERAGGAEESGNARSRNAPEPGKTPNADEPAGRSGERMRSGERTRSTEGHAGTEGGSRRRNAPVKPENSSKNDDAGDTGETEI